MLYTQIVYFDLESLNCLDYNLPKRTVETVWRISCENKVVITVDSKYVGIIILM